MKGIFVLYHQTRSLILRNLLVELNIGLARRIAHRMAKTCAEGYPDLFELATIGLIKAVERYDPSQKYFTSFALPYCKGEILHYLRDKSSPVRIPRGLRELNSKIKKTRSNLANQLGYRPSDKEVALYLGISDSEIQEAIEASRIQKYVWSLDATLDDTDDLNLADSLVVQKLRMNPRHRVFHPEAIPETPTQDITEAILDKLGLAIKHINNPAIDLIFIQGKSIQAAQKLLKLSSSQINALLLQGIEDLARLEICDLDEAVQIASQCEDLKEFSASVGYLLPANSMDFLHDWLFGQLAVA